jgi:hypothetical protein
VVASYAVMVQTPVAFFTLRYMFTPQQTRFVVDDVSARIDPELTDVVCDDFHVEPLSHILIDPNFKSLSAYIHKKCVWQMQSSQSVEIPFLLYIHISPRCPSIACMGSFNRPERYDGN